MQTTTPNTMPVTFLSAIGVWLVMFALFQESPAVMFQDPDTLWHIATGDLQRQAEQFVYHDPWSFTAGSTMWYNASWLWDVIFSIIYEHTGWLGVGIANSVILATTISALFVLCMRRSGHGIAAFIIIVMTLMLFPSHTRPLQLSMLWLTLVYGLLEAVSRQQMDRRWLWVIPPLMVLWANIHGGFLAAFLLLGIYGLTALISKDWSLFKRLLMVGITALLATSINPYGPVFIYQYIMMAMDPMNRVLEEWKPLSLHMDNAMHYIYVVLFLGLFVWRRVSMSLNEILCIGIWLLLGLSSVRHMPIFCIVSAPIASAMLASLMKPAQQTQTIHPWIARCSAYVTAQINQRHRWRWGLLLIPLMVGIYASPTVSQWNGNAYYSPVLDLSEELDYITSHYADRHMYNDYALGGHIIFQSRGTPPVFIDGRSATAYPNHIIRDFAAFVYLEDDWEERFARYPIDAILLHLSHPHVEPLKAHPNWRRVFSGKNAVIFERVAAGV